MGQDETGWRRRLSLNSKKSKSGVEFESETSRLLSLGYGFFRGYPAKVFPLSNYVDVNLRKAGIRTSHLVYISAMFFWAIISFIASFITALVITRIMLPLVNIFLSTQLLIVIPFLTGVVAVGVTMTSLTYYPRHVADNKGRDLEKNLVYVSNYMAIMAGAGATVEQIFESLARHGEVYGVRYLARNAIRNVELLGEDIVSSLDGLSRFSPSQQFSNLLQGFIATMQTGGSLASYLSVMSQEYVESRRQKIRKLIDQMNLVGEVYVSVLVALPIIMITMLSVMGFLGGTVIGGLGAAELMPLLIYVIIPFTAAGIILYMDAVMAGA